jgi:hypothetical protein
VAKIDQQWWITARLGDLQRRAKRNILVFFNELAERRGFGEKDALGYNGRF